MENTTIVKERVNAEDILSKDLAEIYLGNLGTVDTDLSLPKRGKNGSEFTWQTGEILFISNQGKVTRPTFGVGNRDVHLTVTARYGELSGERVFTATVLEEEPKTKIVTVYPLHRQEQDRYKPLPAVCIVKLDNQEYATAEVTWPNESISPEQKKVTGHLKENRLPVELIFVPNYKHDQVTTVTSLATRLIEESLFKGAADRMLHHLSHVDVEQLLYSFRKASGLSAGEGRPMTGWDAPECNLKGHTTGHYLSALSLATYACQENSQYREKVEDLVSGLRECQLAFEKMGMQPGFLSAFSERQFDLLEEYTTYPTIWAPYYSLDKLFQGLLDSYEFAGVAEGLTTAIALGDWTSRRLSQLSIPQLKKMWSIYIAGEFGGMISALVRLYHFTGDNRYLKSAQLFENDKLFIPMLENYDTLDGVHANQHIPQIIGALDIYTETGESQYYQIAENFWQIVTSHHAFSIGGVGETEMFKGHDKIAGFISSKSAESCASHNMLKLSRKLFDIQPKAVYMEYYENVLHNHLLAAASPEKDGGTTYFMPLEPGGQKHFDTSENTCCHGTGLETLLRFQKDIYAFDDNQIYVNLFYPSEVTFESGNYLRQVVASNYHVALEGSIKGNCLLVRKPTWAKIEKIQVNGVCYQENEGDYLIFDNLEEVDIQIDLAPLTRIVATNDDPDTFSVAYGRDILVELSSETNYHYFTEAELQEGVKEIGDDYFLGSKKLIPLNKVGHQAYHAYFKK